ncbi:MAG TPA: hypothetical protein VGA99_06475 [bacterium]
MTTAIGAEGLDESKMLIGNSPEEIRDQIMLLLSDSQLRNDMALRGRGYVEEKFSWQRNLEELDECLLQIEQTNKLRIVRGPFHEDIPQAAVEILR